MVKTLLKPFLRALAVRWAYSFFIFVAMGNDGLMGVDSSSYVDTGTQIAHMLKKGTLQGWGWLGPNPYMMPLHSWLVASTALLAGQYAILCNVLLQGIIDAGTCLLVYGIAESINPRYATAAAVAAAINPTQIVIAGMVYPDTAFVFFVALWLFGALHWLRSPSWSSTFIIAAGLVGSAWCRILVAPFAPMLVIFLVVVVAIAGRFQRHQLLQLGSAFVIFVLSIAPISMRNSAVYGSWALTPQGGIHLARWVVPLIWEVRDGTPWVRGYEEMERRAAELPHALDENTFEQSQRYTKVALEELQRIGGVAIAKGWMIGAALNLGTPAIILAPPVAHLPRTGFYATQGKSILTKIGNFLFSFDNILYGCILLAGVAGLLIVRLLQLAGLGTMLGHGHWMAATLLALWCLFILAINGPVASPKYRLPMEPALAVLTGAGWALLRRHRSGAPSAIGYA